MKKVIVPTDFSETARNAFHYAQDFAMAAGNIELTVVHVFMPQVEAEYPNFVPPVAEFMKIREEMLDEFLQENRKHEAGDLSMRTELLVGFGADEIVRTSEEADFIIMGTTGQSNVLNRIFGSVSSSVAKKAHCPVILVPPGVTFQGIRHILYASNYESAHETMLGKLLMFNRLFNANVHFVHVRTEGETDFSRTKEEIFEDLFESGEPTFAFEIEAVEGETVAEGLSQYADQEPIDLVVMVNCRHSFWESFFEKSQTRRMAIHTKHPLMVLHLES